GTGQPITATQGDDIELPTTVSLFDDDGSEVLDAIVIQGLNDFGLTLDIGHYDASGNYDPGFYFDQPWVIDGSGRDGSDADTEQAFLDFMSFFPGLVPITIHTDGVFFTGDLPIGIYAVTHETSNGDEQRMPSFGDPFISDVLTLTLSITPPV